MDASEIKQIIKEVSNSLKEKGYDPVSQIVGYLISNDLGYIPDFDDNRNKIATLDRTLILESMISDYLK
ncbi:MAG: IreB family regulatory phosphoprotein [Erysipelotrichaceae bacterium]|nr:IreB family regulatory phosphoprotein [Erysipelotrichaceae bacterium]MDD6093219.1 IreB family regulatory phosphoprotein [bacterium]